MTHNELHGILSKDIWSDDIDVQAAATTHLRDLLCSDELKARIDEVIEAGVLPRMADFLEIHDHPELQSAAAGVLSIIASGEHTQKVADQVDISSFVKLLSSEASANQYARDQAVLALGSISSVSSDYRYLVLGGGALSPLLALVGNISGSMQHNAMKTLSELCREMHTGFDEEITQTLPILRQLMYSRDGTIVYYACRALYNLLVLEDDNGKMDRIQIFIDVGICPRLVRLLSHSSIRVVIAALRTIGCIAEIDDAQTQVLMDNEALLPRLYQLLHPDNPEGDICKEVCKAVSYFTSGNRHQVMDIMKSGIMTRLLYHLEHSNIDIKKEAAWAISRTTENGSYQDMRYLVKKGGIKVFCEMLSSPDSDIVRDCLNVLEYILKVGKEDNWMEEDWTNPYANKIKECGGFDKIKTLRDGPTNGNPQVRRLAVEIIEEYLVD